MQQIPQFLPKRTRLFKKAALGYAAIFPNKTFALLYSTFNPKMYFTKTRKFREPCIMKKLRCILLLSSSFYSILPFFFFFLFSFWTYLIVRCFRKCVPNFEGKDTEKTGIIRIRGNRHTFNVTLASCMHFTFILLDRNPRTRDFSRVYANTCRKNCISLAPTKMQRHVDE